MVVILYDLMLLLSRTSSMGGVRWLDSAKIYGDLIGVDGNERCHQLRDRSILFLSPQSFSEVSIYH